MSHLIVSRCFHSSRGIPNVSCRLARYSLLTGLRTTGRDYSTRPNDVNVNLTNGKVLNLSSGRYARFTDGTGLCQMGDTSVLVTAVSKQKPSATDFMPLTVEYRQKSAAAGRIPTNFLRRELGPTEREILTARVIDRSLRPLFPAAYRCETQLACNILAIDPHYSPDVLSINAASVALSLSDIPWNGPVAAVRVGLHGDEVLVNPTRQELQKSQLDLIVTASKNRLIIMLEGKGNEVLMPDVLKAIKRGVSECSIIIQGIERLMQLHGKEKRAFEPPPPVNEDVVAAVHSLSQMRLREVFRNHKHDKISRDQAVSAIRDDVVDKVWSSYPDMDRSVIVDLFSECSKSVFRDIIFEDERCDGRTHDQLRKIACEVDLYKPLHGSALFQRGQTQVLSTVSLDSIESAMKLDSLASLDMGARSKNFFLHYEFPPYATGEIGRFGPTGRREIGHGSLAEKALLPTIPSNYPFTVRLTAEVLESNGSSSMATVCGGSMALMDAGVPITSPAAGVAIGLVSKYCPENPHKLSEYRLLTDILGIEDYLGDMDMKVAGTRTGLTAIQADIKTIGLPMNVVKEALDRAHTARQKILDIMDECIAMPRTVAKDCWPVTEKLAIEPHQRSKLIGPGGLNIRKLYLGTGTLLTQEDECSFTVFAPSQSAMDEAQEMIRELLIEERPIDLEFGAIYTAKIVEIKPIGVMVTLYPSMKPTLLHNSQLDARKFDDPSVFFSVDQEIKVKFFGRDPVSGSMRLSRKVLQL